MSNSRVIYEPWVDKLKTHWLVTLGTLYLSYQIGLIIYNLFFHPLAKVPGPLLGRSTLLWRFWDTTSGKHHKHMLDMHAKYGHVVRVSPNELSFSTVQSYRDIYGVPPPGGQHCIKTEMYDIIGSGFKTADIASERDPQVHAQKKKHLTPAFSARALVAQEAIIHRCLDAFVAKIGPVSQRSPELGINMVSWFEMSAFDLFGEMSFGESFDCIAEEKHHFWIDMVLHHVREIVIMDNVRRFGILKLFSQKLLPKLAMSVLAKHTQYTRDKMQRRLNRESPRQDFFTNLVAKVKAGEVDLEEMTANASTLIIAGGETTATTSAATLYFLLKNPKALAKVTTEVRGRWASYTDIDSNSAQQLPYLQACINEALRLYPSGAQGFPRLSPGRVIDGLWVPRGTEVYTCTWVASRNPDYWNRPDDFIPERWTDPTSTDVKAASQPFSLGYRACPGQSFAMLQLSLVFAKILYTYDLEMLDPIMDWEARSRHWIMWWKPPIRVLAHNRPGGDLPVKSE
ncbi:cytochrome P450 [Ustulina deusta]|nr:cytochrome P450 [Ustulina deusta]